MEDGGNEEMEVSLDPDTKDVAELVTALKDDLKTVKKLKKENQLLKDQINGLLQNNSKFTALVESLDDRLKQATEVLPGRFEYHFMEGGWLPKDGLKKHKIELGKRKADIQNINSQLEEIIRLLKGSKK
jgi:hypothetical protein